MMRSTPSRVPELLFVGEFDNPEFSAGIQATRGAANLACRRDLPAVLPELESGGLAPDFVVIAASRPGEFSPSDIDRLWRAAPLARLVALLGSWCEGEMRTGLPWPGVPRVYAHQAPQRLARELPLPGGSSVYSLPPTASEEERVLHLADRPIEKRSGAIAVHGLNCHVVALLADACRSRGYGVEALDGDLAPRSELFDLGLFECDTTDEEIVQQIADFAAALRPAPVLVVLGFPRSEELAALESAGAAAIVSKPLLIDDLFTAIDSCCRR